MRKETTYESINEEEIEEVRVAQELRKSKRTIKEPTWLQEFSNR